MSSSEIRPLAPNGALGRLQGRRFSVEAGALLALAVGLLAAEALFDQWGLGFDARAFSAALLLAAAATAPSRLHLPCSIEARATRLFWSSPEEIWAAIAPKPTTDFYRADVRRVTQVCEAPPTYRFHQREVGPPCPRCAHHPNPHLESGSSDWAAADWTENRRLHLKRVRTAGAKRPVSRGGEALWTIEPHGGASRVTLLSTTRRPLLSHWLQAQLGVSNPAEDALCELAHHLGEAPGAGGAAAARKMLAAAKSARVYCSCP